MKLEVWKTIDEFPHYCVSNTGKIKSNWHNSKTRNKSIILKPRFSYQGYAFENLYDEKHQMKSVFIHQVVAEYFLPKANKKLQINHINGNKHDNSVENLEWVTASENSKHAVTHGLRRRQIKWTEYVVLRIDACGNVEAYKSMADAAKDCQTTPSNIWAGIKGLKHTVKGFHWIRVRKNSLKFSIQKIKPDVSKQVELIK